MHQHVAIIADHEHVLGSEHELRAHARDAARDDVVYVLSRDAAAFAGAPPSVEHFTDDAPVTTLRGFGGCASSAYAWHTHSSTFTALSAKSGSFMADLSPHRGNVQRTLGD